MTDGPGSRTHPVYPGSRGTSRATGAEGMEGRAVAKGKPA